MSFFFSTGDFPVRSHALYCGIRFATSEVLGMYPKFACCTKARQPLGLGGNVPATMTGAEDFFARMRPTITIIAALVWLFAASGAKTRRRRWSALPHPCPTVGDPRQADRGGRGLAAQAIGVDFKTVDDSCTARGAAAAREFAAAKSASVVGFLCTRRSRQRCPS